MRVHDAIVVGGGLVGSAIAYGLWMSADELEAHAGAYLKLLILLGHRPGFMSHLRSLDGLR